MQAPQIKLELERIVPHQTHCATLKAEKGDCNCSHSKVVKELDTLIFQLLRQIR